MNLKGHAKIELFNAKTGELEQCVEDDNMFTSALDRILNDNLGAFLPDTQATGSYNMVFPLYQYALGGLMLLPETEEENANNLYPHSIPTALGQYGRVSIAGSTGTGIYNMTESGRLENDKGYRHVWEYTTEQGNGTIACASLTNYYGAFGDFAWDEFFRQHKKIPKESTDTAYVGVNSKGKIVAIQLSELSTVNSPKFKLIDTHIIVTKCNTTKDVRIDNTSAESAIDMSEYEVFTINEDYEARSRSYWDPNLYQSPSGNTWEDDLSKRQFGFIWGAFNYDNTHAILFIQPQWSAYYRVAASVGSNYRSYKHPNYIDAYLINLNTAEVSFLNSIFVPLISKTTLAITYFTDPTYFDSMGRSDLYSDREANLPSTIGKTITIDGIEYMSQGFDIRSSIIPKLNGQVYYNNMGALLKNKIVYSVYASSPANGFIYGTTPPRIIVTDPTQQKNTVVYQCPKFISQAVDGPAGIFPVYPNSSWILIQKDFALNIDTGAVKSMPTPISMYVGQACVHYIYSTTFCNVYIRYRNGGYYDSRTPAGIGIGYNQCLYMATINNLPQAITKTSDQTMKVTYTIMDAEG